VLTQNIYITLHVLVESYNVDKLKQRLLETYMYITWNAADRRRQVAQLAAGLCVGKG